MKVTKSEAFEALVRFEKSVWPALGPMLMVWFYGYMFYGSLEAGYWRHWWYFPLMLTSGFVVWWILKFTIFIAYGLIWMYRRG